jgi:Putative beta barrel porin-7 (BBP7)
MRAQLGLSVLAAMMLSAMSPGQAADMRLPVKAPPPAVQSGGIFWIEGEYLLWSTKGDRLPALVTTSPAGTPVAQAGVLGLPTTTVLFGDSAVNDGWRSGGRVKAGYWFDRTQTNGIEAQFFALGDENTSFSASSNGSPILARPFTDAQFGPSANFVAFPGLVSGSLQVNERSSLLGGGIAWRHTLCTACFGDRLEALVGYRYVRLSDRLSIATNSLGTGILFGGSTFASSEQFSSINNFHGVDLGLRGRFVRDAWSLDWVTKVALGVNVNDIAISGLNSITFGGVTTVFPGALLAQPTNIGSFSQNRFAVVPELNLNLGYQITPQLRAFAGYNLLYMTGVVRSGGTIDTTINTSQFAGGALTGPARPRALFSTTDFWAQGLNVGLSYAF